MDATKVILEVTYRITLADYLAMDALVPEEVALDARDLNDISGLDVGDSVQVTIKGDPATIRRVA